MRLSVDPRDGGVRLILPRRASIKAAMLWVEGQRDWIERALEALPEPKPFHEAMLLDVEGRRFCLCFDAAAKRGVVIDGDRLIIGGPAEMASARLLRWLRQRAAVRLAESTTHFADLAGVSVARVSIGDPRTRWGSCSSHGDIRYSWRLILAPSAVMEATVAHEVAHRLHMDHSPAFHAAVERLLGRNPAAERNWLRSHGSTLYWLGREP